MLPTVLSGSQSCFFPWVGRAESWVLIGQGVPSEGSWELKSGTGSGTSVFSPVALPSTSLLPMATAPRLHRGSSSGSREWTCGVQCACSEQDAGPSMHFQVKGAIFPSASAGVSMSSNFKVSGSFQETQEKEVQERWGDDQEERVQLQLKLCRDET